ncbi:2-hydroxychromene-2-carboxylate isomerase [Yangia mangrovi]|uniref:2-hydroxychromene-2-carboxylate isomerase n=1 Tax=Alloyangia mangrovi TaxID=1779329 RepID=A0A2A3JZV5_9RHOB|nr:2-hydroxychromene-2-carboxylate isomerase [Alloyangia mangrovi]MCA0941580.1 2-hydroxychromene-2-carboxylate isomerase [Alloyangia pacifica]MCA0946370.1 2-hydroxychromene-2-carboxylate isomerase [Alloyangia pacifica]MCT4372382.1 2-hydroxychromene-2-carboxylate isomerase [Alloyangia mangrovi]
MAQIQYYFSMLSPFAYLAGPRFAEVAAKHGAEVVYKPFDIMALFPRTGGAPLGQRHPSRIDYRNVDLPRQAKKAGLPLNLKPMFWPTNAAPSSYAIIAAAKAGGGNVGGLIQTLLRNCWAEEKDIAEDAVIKAALEENGFDASLADSGLLVGAETYAANLEEAVGAGVFGSPFWITAEGEKFWGQDRLEDLDLHLSGKL